MTRHDPYESLGLHCSLTHRAFISALERKLKGTGISPAQFIALGQLLSLGPMSQSQLAANLSFKPATGVRLVDRMERDGWVTRQSDPADGRVKRLVPTGKATTTWRKVSRLARQLLNEAYQGIHPSEIETVKRLLDRVRRNLGE